MAFTGKPVIPPVSTTQKANSLKPNPRPGSHPQYVPCHDCGQTGRKEEQVFEGDKVVRDEGDCNLCQGEGWLAT